MEMYSDNNNKLQNNRFDTLMKINWDEKIQNLKTQMNQIKIRAGYNINKDPQASGRDSSRSKKTV